jgi:hypothetical protein
MKQVAAILREVAGGDEELRVLIDRLQDGDDAQRSQAWAGFLARIRRAAGLPDRLTDTGPKELLDLIERLTKETNDGTEESRGPNHPPPLA